MNPLQILILWMASALNPGVDPAPDCFSEENSAFQQVCLVVGGDDSDDGSDGSDDGGDHRSKNKRPRKIKTGADQISNGF